MKLKYIFTLLFFLLLFSCNDSDIGIFYGLKNEEKIKDGSLPNNVTVGSMTRIGTSLYIASGSIYTKPSAITNIDVDWSPISPPSGFDLSLSLASDGTDLYAIYYTRNSVNKGFFRLDGTGWEKIDTNIQGTIEDVKSAGTKIFVSTRINSNSGKLYYYDGTTTPPEIIPDMIGSSFDVIFDGGSYWISNYHKIFELDLFLNPVSTPLSLDPLWEIKGLMEFDGNIYFTYWNRRNLTGYIAFINGDTITSQGIGSFMLNGLKVFTIEGIDHDYPYLLCGTSGRGYYQTVLHPSINLDLQRPRSNDGLSVNYNSAVNLQSAVVLDFFMDPPNDPNGHLYALTATRGLWKNTESGGSRAWSIE